MQKVVKSARLISQITYHYNQTCMYGRTSNTSRTKYKNLNICRFVLQLSLLNPWNLGVKSRMKM